MKRGGPLRRKAGLKPGKGLQPGKGLERSGPLAPKRGAQRSAELLQAAELAARAWHQWAVRNGCEVCPQLGEQCSGPVQGHHPVERQWLRQYARGLLVPKAKREALLVELHWDRRNTLGVCLRAHARHHGRQRPIPQRLLHPATLAFADELGLRGRLDVAHPQV